MPMYRIKEKFWAWDADFFIQDEEGNNLYSLSKKWFALDSAVVLRRLPKHDNKNNNNNNNSSSFPFMTMSTNSGCDATTITTTTTTERMPNNNSNPNEYNENDGGDIQPAGRDLLTIRKRIFSFSPVYQIVRSHTDTASPLSNNVLGEIKEKRIWLQQKHVLEMANVEYIIDGSQWNKKIFSIQHKGIELAHVMYKKKMFDLSHSASFWVDVKVDPTYYEGDAFEEMCLVVLSACIIMIQIFYEKDRQQLMKIQREERQAKLKKMPLQIIHDTQR